MMTGTGVEGTEEAVVENAAETGEDHIPAQRAAAKMDARKAATTMISLPAASVIMTKMPKRIRPAIKIREKENKGYRKDTARFPAGFVLFRLKEWDTLWIPISSLLLLLLSVCSLKM